jgi:hypothetical protein
VDIIETWKLNCEDYPDKSTEWLLQFTADVCDVEVEDVAEALLKSVKKAKPETIKFKE